MFIVNIFFEMDFKISDEIVNIFFIYLTCKVQKWFIKFFLFKEIIINALVISYPFLGRLVLVRIINFLLILKI